jgi:lysophospholipase L1-like esterase
VASRRRQAFFWLLAVSLILSPIAVAEAYLRLALGLGDPVVYDVTGEYRYAPRPNQRLARRHGATVTIDSAGLRGTRDWHEAAQRHVLFVGDSVTWGGSEIDDTETFAAVACARLRVDAVCGNAGVNAYGVDNMVARLDAGIAENADTIVTTLIAGDAIRGMTDFKGLPFFSRRPQGPLKALWEASGILAFRLSEVLSKTPHWQDSGDIPFADRSLDRLVDRLRALQTGGKTVLLVYSPYEGDVPEQPFSTHVRQKLAGSGLPFLDMTGHTGPGAYLDGTHLSAAGHATYGVAITDRLAALSAQ